MGACAGVACCQLPECFLRACMSGFVAFSCLPQGGHYVVEPNHGRRLSATQDPSSPSSCATSTGSLIFCGSEQVIIDTQAGSTDRGPGSTSSAKKNISWEDDGLIPPVPLPAEQRLSESPKLPPKSASVPTPQTTDFTPARGALSLLHPPSAPQLSSTELRGTRRRAWTGVSGYFKRLRASNNMCSQLEDDPMLKFKHRSLQRLDMWRVRGAEKPIWDFYEMISPLGSGAFGTVQKWRLKQAVADEDPSVAVKHIKWSEISDGCFRNQEDEKLIRQELKMLLVLDHPFIIKFREWFEHPCFGIFFVMELCEGRPLQVILEDVCGCGPLETRLAHTARLRRYFREAVYAVSYIHSFKPPVVHRDLKPENMLLKDETRSSCIKLIDFGLAVHRAHASEYSAGMWQRGTPLFMAPETFLSREGHFTPEMDVWALGVIFSWIITALQRGRLQHPMLSEDDGEGFNVRPVPDLMYAYRDQDAWHRELFEGQPSSAFDVADLILVHDSSARPHAAAILAAEWVRCGDPAAAASAQVLRNTNLRSNIETYQALPPLDKCILHFVAEAAPDSDVRNLRRTFRAMDTNGDGRLSQQEILEGFLRNDVELLPEILEGLFDELDDDHSGDITYKEWLAATLGQKILLSPSAVGSAFSHLDSSGTGVLTLEDLQVALGDEAAAEAEVVLRDMATATVEEQPVLSYDDFKRLVGSVADKRLMSAMSLPTIEASMTEAPLEHISASSPA